MNEFEQCFLCCVALRDEDTALVNARTGVPHWYVKRVCRECAGGIEKDGPALWFIHEEWWTLRPRSPVLR